MDVTPEPLAGLIREHRFIEATVTATQTCIAAALTAPTAPMLRDAAIEQLWTLQLVLERDLERHIAKEERVLFPRLRQELRRLSGLMDTLIDEHERIKAQRDRLGETLTLLDDDHADVRAAAARLRDGLERVQTETAPDALAYLRADVEFLDWLFQGHFVGEEDGLFLPAEDLLTAATFAELDRQMAQLDQEAVDDTTAPA